VVPGVEIEALDAPPRRTVEILSVSAGKIESDTAKVDKNWTENLDYEP
jgi:hypothetical protein